MRRTLTEKEFVDEIFGAQSYAWRWEQQPTYWIGYEQTRVQAFLDGRLDAAVDHPRRSEYLGSVRRLTAQGRRLGRVRVVDQPATGYQRWLQWMDVDARAAGEDIHYLARPVLQMMGHPPFEPSADWWLVDGERLLVLRFDDEGRCTSRELIVDEPEVRLARLWRLAVISWAAEEETASVSIETRRDAA